MHPVLRRLRAIVSRRVASILLIHGGDEFARTVFSQEGHADWAQAMPLVLEKLGYLDFEVTGPDALLDPDMWRRRAAVLIARLPAEAWSQRSLESVKRATAPTLIELPPPALAETLGLRSVEASPGEGVVAALAEWLRDSISAATSLSSTRIEPPGSRPVDLDPEMRWESLAVPLTPAQAGAWRTPGWIVQRWEVDEAQEVLAEWVSAEGEPRRWPALIQRGRILAACFSIFGYLGQQTTIAPSKDGEYASWSRSTALEAMLAALLDRMHAQAGRARARVLPWPAGARWVLNVRHDFDRPLDRPDVQRVLSAHRARGTAATWYWRARHLSGDGESLARLVDRTAGHEVAHHTERLWQDADGDEQVIERALSRRVSGTCAHGDPHCFRWQGAPNVLWAERRGMRYTEFISHAHLHPHRASLLEADGCVRMGEVICLPHHVSFDRSMNGSDAAVEPVLAAAGEYVRAGGMMQIMNHPDLNHDSFFAMLERLPLEGRLDWTADAAADWWRRTHVQSQLEVKVRNNEAVDLVSRTGVRGLALEVLMPDGERRNHVVSIDPGAELSISIAGGAGRALTRDQLWRSQASPILAEAVRSYYAGEGINPRADEVKATVATNTNLVPSRVRAILDHASELRGSDSLAGLRILDVGCGFGAFAAYLALDPDAPLVTAVDIRTDFIATASDVGRRIGLDNLEFVVTDARSLTGLGRDSFDLVVVNNSFIYLPTEADMLSALDEIVAATAPGGAIVFHHANLWTLRDPFTRSPLVHLLPARVAEMLSRRTGWRHSHGRVRLVSAPWLARQLRRRGVRGVSTHPRGGRALPPRGWFTRFYAVRGRKG